MDAAFWIGVFFLVAFNVIELDDSRPTAPVEEQTVEEN